MKALPKKLLPLILSGIGVTSPFSVQPAQAYTVTLEQVGSDVAATGSGSINLTGLTFVETAGPLGAFIHANIGLIETVQTSGAIVDIYTGFTGPTSFGSGAQFSANTGSGDFVGIADSVGSLGVPTNYVSGAALMSSSTWNSATFASLGVIPGTYTWTWGTGLPNQNFTLMIGRATVPDGGTTVSLLGFALLGLAALRRKLGCKGEVMKASPKKLLPLIVFGIAVTSLFSVQPVQAFTITMEQVGSNVVANGSGAINLTGLTFDGSGSGGAADVFASSGGISIGATVDTTLYNGFTGPTSFGSGGVHFANTSSGDFVSIFASGGFFFQDIFLPTTYVSNAALSDSMTFNNATFATLGVIPGTYTWTWGTGLPNQNFTLIIGRAGVPDGGSTVSLLGCALLGLAALSVGRFL